MLKATAVETMLEGEAQRMTRFAPLALALLFAGAAHAESASQTLRREHPCPAPGSLYAECDLVLDYFLPVCLGGTDEAANVWLEEPQRSFRKDGIEGRYCYFMRQIERDGNDPRARDETITEYLENIADMGGEEAKRAGLLLSALAAKR
jgi:hypothetical protein